MRRRSSKALPDLPSPEPRGSASGARPARWSATLPLRVITPIVGGGVEAMEPDGVDIVRLPEVRGVLRWWWRALYAGGLESADQLFRREAGLWGGVDVPGEEENHSCPSRVRLQARILDPGRVVPAGTHQTGRDGKPRAFPTWTLGRSLGYALFPLQRTTDERRAFRGQAMPTRSVRTGVRFELMVQVLPPVPPEKASDEEKRRLREKVWPGEVREVLFTLRAWIHLGGLGARTRRGFGALALDGEAKIEAAPPGSEAAADPFAEDLETGWRQIQSEAQEGSRLAGARLLVGPEARDDAAAHEALISALWTFRQGVGFAREAGRGRPGHSRWPEGNLLRSLQAGRAEGGGDSEEEPGVPRAAFGMPLIVQFKDAADRGAGGTIVPAREGGDRWASPVLLRPSGPGPRGHHPLVLILGGERPRRALVTGQAGRPEPTPVPIESAAGAQGEPRRLLEAAGGEAVKAFAAWLERDGGFRELGGGERRRP